MLTKLRSLPVATEMARDWWSTPTDRDAQVAYFAQRGLLGGVQLVIGACTAVIAVVPLVVYFSPAGPGTAASRVISLGLTVSAIPWVLLWWFGHWPSRWTSVAFVAYADVAITIGSLQHCNHLVGLLDLMLLGLISLYLEFFEGPKVLVLHMGWMLISVSFSVALIATGPHGDPLLAAAKFIVAIVSLVATPAFVHCGISLMHNDAADSLNDQLTGLLNRRGLNLLVANLLQDPRHRVDAHVMVTVIDLDRFKHINDTHGHAEGDAVLVRSARRIKSALRADALVARMGGEEFGIIDVVAADHVPSIAERVRASIAARSEQTPVTASIGIATVALADVLQHDADSAAVISAAIERADHAMFEAKHRGGNAVVTCPIRR
ncbi:diguanylate cyclase (GGDEF)-like protein [Mycobacterium sp. MAA66]|uniref:GGDEF domain-containing protein n=1 Tax=Mycobacterium sp. MAA66 TaxID=3156297 RepID=UPI003511A395